MVLPENTEDPWSSARVWGGVRRDPMMNNSLLPTFGEIFHIRIHVKIKIKNVLTLMALREAKIVEIALYIKKS